MNRVSQVYEDDLSIRMQLIANNDLLNFDTWDEAIGPNGPCGVAACYTQAQVTGCSNLARNRTVIGQIIGASNWPRHRPPRARQGAGRRRREPRRRGPLREGAGLHRHPDADGDFYAIDYVAHEMGHQFSGNHPFNGTQLNCSGGIETAPRRSRAGPAPRSWRTPGICMTDDLQPHSDPYFSQRSLQEISTYTASNQLAINEVQGVALRHFGGGNEVQSFSRPGLLAVLDGPAACWCRSAQPRARRSSAAFPRPGTP